MMKVMLEARGLCRVVPLEMHRSLGAMATAKKAWDSLKMMRSGASVAKRAKILQLRQEYELLEFKDGEGIEDFSLRLSTLVTRLKKLGQTLEDVDVISKFLCVVPSKFSQLAQSIETLVNLETLTIEDVVGRFRVWRIGKRRNAATTYTGRMMSAGAPPRAVAAAKAAGMGSHGGMATATSEVEEKAQGKQLELNEPRAQVLLGEEDKAAETEHMRWYLDSRANNHMTGRREDFAELDSAITSLVKFGDGSTVTIHRRGTMVFKCQNGDHRALTDVYYIPQLCKSIASLEQLDETGC
ncbi:hypothetical protein U9M48_013356 [Paspalum notatum var. saurae]|uniref:Retrovirus-related Pol polyprotein from transposon TNT 1-94-like beta-barrel domain-containing protein n=1 Tax=Paspalum notatum var. saurae TaxID=547442 RepID=A0AAQ3WJH6_PASNO